MLSRSAASRVAERLWDDYQAFATRSLKDLSIVYLFVDGVAERLHLGQPREAVLAAWGIDASGTKHLLRLLPGTNEDTALLSRCIFEKHCAPRPARWTWPVGHLKSWLL